MHAQALQKLLQLVADGSLSVADASRSLSGTETSHLGFARVDHSREFRQGVPEVVFGEKKSVQQLTEIVGALKNASQNVLVTRVDSEKAAAVRSSHPDLVYSESGRTLSVVLKAVENPFADPIAVVTAGTSDQSVAEEAAITLEVAGVSCRRFYDVGVSGIHRLFEVLPEIQKAPAVICIAGMEGALPSVLGGLVRSPVVAVPTSVGYGAALDGFAALLGMLTGCASGVTVVNIDNGFGAAMAVLRLRDLAQVGDGT